jgi:hypothetical protein
MMHSTATTPGSSSSEGLERYVSGIETGEGLVRLAKNVSAHHDRLPYEACSLVSAVVPADDSPRATLGHLRSCSSGCGPSDKRAASPPARASELI